MANVNLGCTLEQYEVRTVVSVSKSEKLAQIIMRRKPKYFLQTISPKTLFTLNVSSIYVVLGFERSPLVNSPRTLYLVLQMEVYKKH